jgi:hypothetical protein
MLQLFKKKNKEKLPARLRGNSCLNCNVTLAGEENFCHNCGQRNNINQLSFKLFVEEFFGDIFSYDSRLWGTVFPLIIKPGKVAYEFVLGKRKEFVNPFRTYLTVSLIFFLIYGLLNTFNQYNNDGTEISKNTFLNFNFNNDDGKLSTTEKDSILNKALANVKEDVAINLDSTLRANNVNLDSINLDKTTLDTIKKKAAEQNKFAKKVTRFYDYYEENKEDTVAHALDSLGYKNTFWNRFYYDKAISTHEMLDDKGESLNQKIFSGLSIAIFLFLPVFALFLKLIYIRRKYTYMEHMVFVFYTQSVFFLLLLLFLIIYFFSSGQDRFIAVPIVLFAIYLWLAMKKFYQQGWIKTTFKYFLANFSFMIISTIGFILLTLISFVFY